MAATNANKRWFLVGALSLALGILLLILLPICGCQRGSESRRSTGAPALDVDSTKLLRTRVVATLDTPLHPGTNLIWCASFQLAWKEFATALKEKQPVVEGAEALCRQLNAAADPRDSLPVGGFYAAAGKVADGIVARIRNDMQQAFPSVPLPKMEGFQPDDLVAYAFLEANVQFKLPYLDSDSPIPFRESRWRKPTVMMFGIGCSKTNASPELRGQVSVLFYEKTGREMDAFALDLDRNSSPYQLIVARLAPQATLASTVKFLEDQLAAVPQGGSEHGLGGHDTLLVPEMNWRILREFVELEGRRFLNPSLREYWVRRAAQGVSFRLDRSGAALQSDAIIRMMKGRPRHFECDRPFLIYMKKRGADQPFFVAWIDNAELLRRWE